MLPPLFHTTSVLLYSIHINMQKHVQISRMQGHNHLIIPLGKSNLATENSEGVNWLMKMLSSGVFTGLRIPALLLCGSNEASQQHHSSKNKKTKKGTKSFPSHLLPVK